MTREGDAAGLGVGPFAFGGAPLGGLYDTVSDSDAHDCLQAAWDAGVRYFDTAPHYGAGLSERRIGAFLSAQPRSEVVVSTKVGRLLEPADGHDAAGFVGEPALRRVFDFSRDGVLRSWQASLERLGLDRVDALFLHDPDDHWQQAVSEGLPALAELRAQGLVRWIGAGMNGTAMLTRFVQDSDIDLVLLAGRYTLLDQSALDDLLPACLSHGTQVVAGGVFNSGILADPRPGARYDYAPASAELLDRAKRIEAVCLRFGVPIAAAAARFPSAHPAVATVLLGARNAAEVAQNAAHAALPIDPQLWDELRAAGLLRADAPVPSEPLSTSVGGVPCT